MNRMLARGEISNFEFSEAPRETDRVHWRCLASRHDVVLNVVSACLASSREGRTETAAFEALRFVVGAGSSASWIVHPGEGEGGATFRPPHPTMVVSAFSRCGVVGSGLNGSSRNHGAWKQMLRIVLSQDEKSHRSVDPRQPAGAVWWSYRERRSTSSCWYGRQPRSAVQPPGRDSRSGERRPHEWIDPTLTWSMSSMSFPRSWAPTAYRSGRRTRCVSVGRWSMMRTPVAAADRGNGLLWKTRLRHARLECPSWTRFSAGRAAGGARSRPVRGLR